MSTTSKYAKTPSEFDEFEQQIDGLKFEKDSVWKNPTQNDVKILLHEMSPVCNGQAPRDAFTRTGKRPFLVKAGESEKLPARFDRAIHEHDANGFVCGGLAPQLVKEGEEDRPINAALDVERSLRLQAQAEAAAHAIKAKDSTDAFLIAQARVKELEREIEEARAFKAKAEQDQKASTVPVKAPNKG